MIAMSIVICIWFVVAVLSFVIATMQYNAEGITTLIAFVAPASLAFIFSSIIFCVCQVFYWHPYFSLFGSFPMLLPAWLLITVALESKTNGQQ